VGPRRGTTENGPAASRTQAIFDELRADILGGRLAPGDKLQFARLVEHYRGSIGAIREALQRLAEQGLVQSEAQQGFRVVRISQEDLADLTEARCAIEGLAIRMSAEAGDVQWESEIVAAHHILSRAPQFADPKSGEFTEEWADAHRRFHLALIRACPNRRILAMAEGLRDSAELYRRWSASVGSDRDRDLATEHRELLELCLARDSENAQIALTKHLQRTSAPLLKVPTD
jgi:DNA-binding GntR family transcriptional regulator